MPGVLQSASGVVRAHCAECAWTLERSLEAGDDLSPEDNQEIAARVVRSHAFRCPEAGEWGETVTVEMDLTGGGHGDE